MSGGSGETMTSRRAQIARMRRVALAALDRYALPDGRLTFVTHGENTTFRHDSAAGRYLVRVHRPQRHGADVDSRRRSARRSAWLGAIRAGTDLSVPEALAATDGATTVEATGVRTRPGSARCSAGWTGASTEGSARPVHLRRLGAAMARLHDQADGWTPPPDFVRIRWDYETFFGDVMVYGETSGRRLLGTPPGRGTRPLRGGGAPGWPTSDARRRHRAHPCRPAPRQRAVPARRRQADRLRRLRHRPAPVRARRRPVGTARRGRTTRRSGTRCWHGYRQHREHRRHAPGRLHRHCGRSPSTSGTPAWPRSTRRSRRGSTGSIVGRC